MNRNTSSTGGRVIRTTNLFLVLIVVVLVILTFLGLRAIRQAQEAEAAAVQATVEVERGLTDTYGEEVGLAIERFHSGWHSLETHFDPAIQSELATSQYVEYRGMVRGSEHLADEPYWLVTTSVTVEGVRVLEYSPQRLKAIGCIVEYGDEVTTEGEFVRTLSPRELRFVYVFVREDGVWKLSAEYWTFDPSEARSEWEFQPEWLRNEIGDLEEYVYKDCEVAP